MVMLELDRVNIAVDGRPILHDLNLRIESGETHVLCGLKRLGETSIMGLPRYQVTSGMIRFQGQDLARGFRSMSVRVWGWTGLSTDPNTSRVATRRAR